MSKSNSVGRVGLRAAAVLALTVCLPGCTTEESAVGDPGACTHVDAPMLDIPTASPTEPQMRIPVPPGWTRTTEVDNVNEIIRFALTNTVLVTDEPQRNIVGVNLLTGPPDVEAQTAFDEMRTGLVKDLGWTDFETTAGTVCGRPAQTHTRDNTDVGVGTMNLPPQTHHVSTLHVVTKADDHTYMVTVTAGTMPDNPKYQRDAEMILKGFQVLPPARR